MVTLDDIRALAGSRENATEASYTGKLAVLALNRHSPVERLVIASAILSALAGSDHLDPKEVVAACEGAWQ